MSALESPLEALAFSYLSFGFLAAVNSVWTWLAVITTAAVSLWRIRASSPRAKSLDDASSSQPAWFPSSTSPVWRVAAGQKSDSTSGESSASASIADSNGRTSGKFVLYYNQSEEDDCGRDDVIDDGGDSETDDREELPLLGDSWGEVMKVRTGDLGWHGYQDLTVLDGSVVRLWDGCRRRRAAPLEGCGGEGLVAW